MLGLHIHVHCNTFSTTEARSEPLHVYMVRILKNSMKEGKKRLKICQKFHVTSILGLQACFNSFLSIQVTIL